MDKDKARKLRAKYEKLGCIDGINAMDEILAKPDKQKTLGGNQW